MMRPSAGPLDDIGTLLQQATAPATQQVADAVVLRLSADTALQERVGAAAGKAAAEKLSVPVYIATGAVVVGALALVYMAVTRSSTKESR